MKILVIGDDRNGPGGIASMIKNIELIFKGNDIDFICPFLDDPANNGIGIFKKPGISLFGKIIFFIKMLTYEKKIRKLIKDKKYDLYILNAPRNILAIKNGNVVIYQHAEIDRWFTSFSYFGLVGQKKKIINKINRLNALIISPLEKYVDILSINFNNVCYIPPLCKEIKYCEEKRDEKAAIMFARLDNSIKRFDLAIDVFKKLPEFKLDIYGDGRDKLKIEKIIENYDNINLFEYDENICSKLKYYKVFLLLSETEGYGMSGLEAYTSGLRIISRNKLGISSEITDSRFIVSDDVNEIEMALLLAFQLKPPIVNIKKYSVEEVRKKTLEKIGENYE